MLKTLSNLLKVDKEKYKVPRRVQDVIPIRRIWSDGIFLCANQFCRTWRFSDINYQVASEEDKKYMFLDYSELLNLSLIHIWNQSTKHIMPDCTAISKTQEKSQAFGHCIFTTVIC